MQFRDAREKRAEQLLQDVELCDAIAVVGTEKTHVPCHRALLANISEPLRKAFFGDFQESKDKQVALPEVAVAAFTCITRHAANLDPKLDAENVLPTLRASKMYMIQDLLEECEHYMNNSITPETALTILTACITANMQLSEDVEIRYWAMLLENSKRVLESTSFLHAHSEILVRLLKLDEFSVSEESLWSRLVEWATSVQDRMELWTALLNDIPEGSELKRPRNAIPANGDASKRQALLLQGLAKHVRLPILKKEFFVDNVRQHLTREDSDAIMTHFLLKRPLQAFSAATRTGLRPKEELLQFSISSLHEPQNAERLPQGDASWMFGTTAPRQILRIDMPEPITLTMVRLTFGPERKPWSFKISTTFEDHGGKIETDGRMLTWKVNGFGLTPIRFERHFHITPVIDFPVGQLSTTVAALVRVECFGKKTPQAYAVDVISKHSSDVLLLQRPM